MFNIFKKKDPIDVFWEWFSEHRREFENLTKDNANDKLTAIGDHLRMVTDGLIVEISKNKDGLRDLTISAEGEKEKFPDVQDIVRRAPEIPGWTVSAFRQRTPPGFVFRSDVLTYDTAEMYFEPIIEGENLNVIVYANDLNGVDEEVAFQWGIVLMDNLLGEYDTVMSVKAYDFLDISEAENVDALKPLRELPEFVDQFVSTQVEMVQ